MTKYIIRYKIQYVPTYYVNLNFQQKEYQTKVLNFKKGISDQETYRWFNYEIEKRINFFEKEYAVCFIPASSGDEITEERYKELYTYLLEHLSCDVYLNDIGFTEKDIPKHLTGEENFTRDIAISVDHIFGKNIILIDDVITSGRTFEKIADKLMAFGALNVYGMFFAKTVNPDLPISPKYQEKKARKQKEREDFQNYVEKHLSKIITN